MRHAEITAGGQIRIEAGNGVVVDYKPAGRLSESVASLSRLPELAWMAELKAREGIDWRAIEEVHDYWQRHESGIGGPGVTLVAMAVGGYLGAIDFSQLLGTGFTGSVATGFNAGMSALAQHAGVSLIANGGDIGAVFEDLLSSDTLLNLATASLTAGLTNNLYGKFNLPSDASASLGGLTAEQLFKKVLIDSAVQTGLDASLYGSDPVDALLNNLQVASVTTVGGKLAAKIGEAYYKDRNRALQLIAQSAVGCGLGAGTGGDCGSGAAGAVLGEIIGETFLKYQLANKGLEPEELAALQRQGINVAGLTAGYVVALAGGDIGSAGRSARLVAQENATKLIVSIGKAVLRLKKTWQEKGRLTVEDILKSPYAELASVLDDVNTLLDPEKGRIEKARALMNIALGFNDKNVGRFLRITSKNKWVKGFDKNDKVVIRTTRHRDKAVRITKEDGSYIDISPRRVKEGTLKTHPEAPPGTIQKTKYDNALTGSKGNKRKPTQQELDLLEDLTK